MPRTAGLPVELWQRQPMPKIGLKLVIKLIYIYTEHKRTLNALVLTIIQQLILGKRGSNYNVKTPTALIMAAFLASS